MSLALPLAFPEAAASAYLTDAEWDALGEDWAEHHESKALVGASLIIPADLRGLPCGEGKEGRGDGHGAGTREPGQGLRRTRRAATQSSLGPRRTGRRRPAQGPKRSTPLPEAHRGHVLLPDGPLPPAYRVTRHLSA